MIKKLSKFLMTLFCLIVLINANKGFAAQILIEKKGSNKTATLRFIGEVQKGDARKMAQTLSGLIGDGYFVRFLWLFSMGGNVEEAMEIGHWLRSLYIQTNAPLNLSDYRQSNCLLFNEINDADCNCASACFLIWAAGIDRRGDILGLHRPYFGKEYFNGLSAQKAKEKYDSMSKGVKDYLRKMSIPDTVIETMFITASDDVIYLDEPTVKSMENIPFFDEWVKSGCGPKPSYEEILKLIHFERKMENRHRSVAGLDETAEFEQWQYEKLSKKVKNFRECRNKKVRSAQQKALKDLKPELDSYLDPKS